LEARRGELNSNKLININDHGTLSFASERVRFYSGKSSSLVSDDAEVFVEEEREQDSYTQFSVGECLR